MQQPRVELITLCDYALNSKDGKLSIMGIFDRIFVPAVPTHYSRFFVVVILNGEGTSRQKVLLKLESPAKVQVLPPKEVELVFSANGKANIITDVTHLNLQEIGEYTFTVSTPSGILGQTSLFVSRLEPQKPNQLLN